MPFSVECYFDPVAEDAVRNIWRALAEMKINTRMLDVSARPHLSLTVAEHNVPAELPERLRDFVMSRNGIQLQFGSLGLFPNDLGVLFLAPRASIQLDHLHLDWCTAIDPLDLAVWDYYRAGHWTPHCTLAVGLTPDQFGAAFDVCRSTPFPLLAEIREIGLVKLRPLERLRTFTFLSNL
jgi:hypothetical protein